MASNVIIERVLAFLRHYPPFSYISADILKKLSAEVEIRFLPKGEMLFQRDEPPHKFIYVVKEGLIHLFHPEEENDLIDICDEGDVFGIRAMLSGQPYIASARAAEESLLYCIPVNAFLPVVKSSNDVSMFFASGFAAGQPVVRTTVQKSNRTRIALKSRKTDIDTLFELQNIGGRREVITAAPDESIKTTAQRMTDHGIGSIIICDTEKRPVGIVTEADFKRKVVTGRHSIDEPVKSIMSFPVLTISNRHSVADILIEMVKYNIRHLCITVDGTDRTKATGVISERDILMIEGNNPAVLIKQIRKANALSDLREIRDKAETLLQNYLEQEVSLTFLSEIISSINDTCIQRIIFWAEEAVTESLSFTPSQKYAWLSLGSEGREEQLLRTDQDNALIYEDPDEKDRDKCREWFLLFAERVNAGIEELGFERCPADIMARNQQWCQPISEWKKYFHDWVFNPEPKKLMHSTIFFDFRTLGGDKKLEEYLRNYLFEITEKESVYLNHLANNAIQNPAPKSFFRDFVLEKKGEHNNEFDIKSRGLMPLADAARVLALRAKYHGSPNTVKRFRFLAEKDKKKGRLFREAAMAYAILSRFRAIAGLKNSDSGRYIRPQSFNKLERQTLKSTFATIDDIQDYLKSEFQLQFFR